jgi:hypothetical protein
MTKQSKERMIAFYVEKLNWLDMFIELNDDDDAAIQSLRRNTNNSFRNWLQ